MLWMVYRSGLAAGTRHGRTLWSREKRLLGHALVIWDSNVAARDAVGPRQPPDHMTTPELPLNLPDGLAKDAQEAESLHGVMLLR